MDTLFAGPMQSGQLVVDENMETPIVSSSDMGSVGVFSARSPAKESANEDAAAVMFAGDEGVVLAVADGVGGHSGGERASRIALECLRDAVELHSAAKSGVPAFPASAPSLGQSQPSNGNGAHANSTLRTAILNGLENANRDILALGTGAATTLAVAEIVGRTMRPYHVGDSLILLVGGHGKIKFQAIPHSPVGYGIEAGLIDESEAMHHEDRHVVSNIVGCPDMRIEIGPARTLSPRDTLLLASDGLSDNLHVGEIVETIRKGRIDDSIQSLAEIAQERMRSPQESQPSKPDDLTIVLFRLRK